MIDHGDKTIGAVGVNAGEGFPETEIGWLLYDGHEGNGYATEAASALRHYTYAETSVKTLVSYIDPDNAGSIAVASRLGAILDHAAPKPEPGTLVYRHPGPEALQ